MNNIAIIFCLILFFGSITIVSANDLSPYASTMLVLDNINEFPDYTFFISSAGEDCGWMNQNIALNGSLDADSEQLRLMETLRYKQCNFKQFDKKGKLLNFVIGPWGENAGQCISPGYAIKTSEFDEASFRNLNICDQDKFLEEHAIMVTSERYSGRSASSYSVILVEEHFTIDLNATQEEPSKVVERTRPINWIMYLIVLSVIALIIVAFTLITRKK